MRTEPDLRTIIQTASENAANGILVMDLCRIERIDMTRMTVDAQPLVQMVDNSGQWTPKPLLVDIPMAYSQGGNTRIRIAPQIGDVCLVIYGNDCPDSVYENPSQTSRPPRIDYHSINNGIAICGIFPQNADPLSNVDGFISVESPLVKCTGAVECTEIHPENGATGVFVSQDGKTVNVVDGIITEII